MNNTTKDIFVLSGMLVFVTLLLGVLLMHYEQKGIDKEEHLLEILKENLGNEVYIGFQKTYRLEKTKEGKFNGEFTVQIVKDEERSVYTYYLEDSEVKGRVKEE